MSQAWPELAASKLSVNLDLLACAGATTDALTSSYDSQDPQLADLQGVTAPALVTITMGGNDLGFVWVLADCYASLCSIGLSGVEGALAGGFGTHMTHVYEAIKAAAPGAHILVVGYPQIVPSNSIKALLRCPWFKSSAEVLQMRLVSSQIDSVLARAAAAAGVNYVSTLDVLKGHELCTADSWVNSVSPNIFNHTQGHPNAPGQAAIAAAVEDYVVHHHLLP